MWNPPGQPVRTGFDHVQAEVQEWGRETFRTPSAPPDTDPLEMSNVEERCCRFLEESLELVQSLGFSLGKAYDLAAYVYGRPIGVTKQEVGGTIITLAALANAADISLEEAFDNEMARIWNNREAIRVKQAQKNIKGEGL